MSIQVIYFADGGTPKTGLTPTVDIYVKTSDGLSAGTVPTVSELSGGAYKFSYSVTEEVFARVDSEDVAMADAERYIPLVLNPLDNFVDVKGSPFAG